MGITKKVIASFVGFATAVTMTVGTASAQSATDLQAQIASLLATIQGLQAQLNAQTGGTAAVGGYTFATNLKLGSSSVDVQNLQKILNMDPATQVATSGAGAPGSESTYFGAKTKAAVIKFQEKYAADILTPLGLTSGTGLVGASMRAYLNAHYAGTPGTPGTPGTTVPTGTNLSVALSADTPSASNVLIAGQAVGDLAHFTFTNPTAAPIAITNLQFTRTGVSNDATLANVYLFNGVKRLADSATVSNTKVTFNDPSGIFTIPAGSSMVVAVKADITASTNGQIIGVSLTSVTAGTATVGGTFPINGNNISIATALMATVDFTDTTPSPSTAGVDPQTEYTMWQGPISFGIRAVNMKSITFRQIGSVATADLANFKLMLDGVQLGTTVASLDANGYVTFDLSASPKYIETGTRTLKLIGDIVGGSTKTFSFSLQNAGDAVFTDSQIGAAVLVTAGGAGNGFSALSTGTQAVNGGTLTITKKSDSPSGNVTLTGSNVLLAKFEVKAAGEPMKVESLDINATISTGDNSSLRNGAIFADGVQIGNTTSLHDDVSYTRYTFGSSLVVTPGKPVVLEVRADIYNDHASGTTFAAGHTIKVNIAASAVNNIKKVNSLTYTTNTAVAANTLTVAVGSLSGAKNSSYANQTVVTPKTAYKIASFVVTSNETEKVNLDTISITWTGASVGVATGLTDVYVQYGAKTSSVKSTVASTTSWSISEEMAANSTMNVDVYASLTSSMVDTDTLITGLTVSGTTALSAASKSTGELAGQTITASTGTIAAAKIDDSSVAIRLLVGNTTPKVASFRFTAVNDSYTLTDIALKADGSNGEGAIRSLVLKSSGMADKVVYLGAGNIATSSGMTLAIPANDSNGKVVDIYVNLNDVSAAAATSSANVMITLDTYKTLTSGGTEAYGNTDITTNAQYVYKSVPTITYQTLPTTLLTASTLTLAKFTIAADTASSIGWKRMLFTINKTAGIDLGGSTMIKLYDASGTAVDGTFATGTAAVEGTTGLFTDEATSGTVIFTATNEQQITTSETYSLKDSVTGTATAGTYVSTSLTNPSTWVAPTGYNSVSAAASFVWSDRSANSHANTTADWNNDYKVKNLPTDSWTLTGSSSG